MFPAAIGIAPSTVTGEEIYKIGIRIMQVLQHYSLSMRFVTSLETGASGTPLLSRSLATSSKCRYMSHYNFTLKAFLILYSLPKPSLIKTSNSF